MNIYRVTSLKLILAHQEGTVSHKRNGLIFFFSLRKHAYLNILKILPPKNKNFQMKDSDIFRISAQNINCGYSFEPPR